MPPRKNLVGQTFDRWFVESEAGINHKTKAMDYNCTCKCGTKRAIQGARLTNRKSRSCGCLQRETIGNMRRKHNAASGYAQTAEYAIWQAMLRRCTTKTHKHYADYGGRGITVCERWLPSNNGFTNFLEDMGIRPEPKLTLERRNNDLGYSKENCYWAPWLHQGKNKRNSRKLEFRGRNLIVAEWSRETGIPYRTILNRMDAGKSAEEILYPYSARADLPPITTAITS